MHGFTSRLTCHIIILFNINYLILVLLYCLTRINTMTVSTCPNTLAFLVACVYTSTLLFHTEVVEQTWCMLVGANNLEPTLPIISQCNGIFTGQSIFWYFSHEIGQFQSIWASFGEDKTMRPSWTSRHHVYMSTSVRACVCNWSLEFQSGSEFEINSN